MAYCVTCGCNFPDGRPCPTCLAAVGKQPPGRYEPSEPQERELVTALRADPRDDAIRQVYADWLEQHGYELRSRFLRIECRRADDADVEVQLRALAMDTPIDRLWRAVASRAPVDCDSVDFTFHCPKRWDSLTATDSDTVRHCAVCAKEVYFCATVEEAQQRAAARQCVAIDARLVRADVATLLARARAPYPVPMMTGMVAYRPGQTPSPPISPPMFGEPKRGLFARIAGLFKKSSGP